MLLLRLAKEAGFSISADDLKNAASEMSEEELEGVAGGFVSGGFGIRWAWQVDSNFKGGFMADNGFIYLQKRVGL